MTARVVAIVLAAGAGRRMGFRPKALLPIDGESFLARVVRTCRDGGCVDVWIVVPAEPPGVLAFAQSLRACAIVNPDPERGMLSSVQIGVRAAAPATAGTVSYLVFPVDHPRVQASTVRSLLGVRVQEREGKWIRPVYEGRGGHPILVPGPATAGLLERDPREPLRDALRGIGLEPLDVPVEDPGVLVNLNLPEQISE
jgi:CTP:molybdopterin cytidylyltransferase MocA